MGHLLSAMPADDWADARRIADRFDDAEQRLGFLLIRPEAVRQGFAGPIIDRLAEIGLAVADVRWVSPHPRELEELYRFTQVRLMSAGNRPMWWYTPRYYQLGPAIAVLVAAGEGAAVDHVSRLLRDVKGPSNPSLTTPGQLRFDFRSQNMVMCVVHCADPGQTMVREACLFFGAERVADALESGPVPAAAHSRRRGLIDDRPVQPEPHFHQALAELQARILRGSACRQLVGAAELARRLTDLAADTLNHPEYTVRTHHLLNFWQSPWPADVLRALASVTADEVVFLIWSARLVDTATALADLALDRLEARGYRLPLYQRILLETGFGFHPWISAGFRPTTDDAEAARADLAGTGS